MKSPGFTSAELHGLMASSISIATLTIDAVLDHAENLVVRIRGLLSSILAVLSAVLSPKLGHLVRLHSEVKR